MSAPEATVEGPLPALVGFTAVLRAAGLAITTDRVSSARDFRDGMSNTTLVGEGRHANGDARTSANYGPFWAQGVHTSSHGRVQPPTNTTHAN